MTMHRKANHSPAPQKKAEGERVDLWPAMVWIAVGVGIFTATPALFAWWRGVIYFLIGAPLLLWVTGAATARLHDTIIDMVGALFARHNRLTITLLLLLLDSMRVILVTKVVLIAANGMIRVLNGG